MKAAIFAAYLFLSFLCKESAAVKVLPYFCIMLLIINSASSRSTGCYTGSFYIMLNCCYGSGT